MEGGFQITKRHYDIIMHQVRANLPQESGGFLGGTDGLIKAILPLFNKHLFNKTDTFAYTGEDLERAMRFFEKHKCDYYGLYHSHPSGEAIPSDPDIATRQKYHFIIGAANPENLVLTAWQVFSNKEILNLPIKIVSDDTFSVASIHSNSQKSNKSTNVLESAAEELSIKIDAIKKSKKIVYKKNKSIDNPLSEFNTLA